MLSSARRLTHTHVVCCTHVLTAQTSEHKGSTGLNTGPFSARRFLCAAATLRSGRSGMHAGLRTQPGHMLPR